MGCKFSNFNGKCTLDGNIGIIGTDEEGNCVVEDDPNPEDSCESYESNEETEENEEE